MRGLFMALHQMVMFADSDKYFWVQAESLAAAALLAQRLMMSIIGSGMIEFGVLVGSHMIDHKYGAWYRILDFKQQ